MNLSLKQPHEYILLLGWIVTFIIRERHGGSNAGYISSGFFGGMTLGRVVLMWFNRKVCQERIRRSFTDGYTQIGVRNVIFLYAILAIGSVNFRCY